MQCHFCYRTACQATIDQREDIVGLCIEMDRKKKVLEVGGWDPEKVRISGVEHEGRGC